MFYLISKTAITAGLVLLASELAKRSLLVGSVIASLPLVSVLAMVWLFIETKDADKVANLAIGIFWMVLSSLLFFVVVPFLIKQGVGFYSALSAAVAATACAYGFMVYVLRTSGYS